MPSATNSTEQFHRFIADPSKQLNYSVAPSIIQDSMGVKMDCSNLRYHTSWSTPDLIRLPATAGLSLLDSTITVVDYAPRLSFFKRQRSRSWDGLFNIVVETAAAASMTPTTAPTTPTTPTSSEESGYNEADSENLSAPPTDVIRMGARTFRRPSVVVSDYDNSVNDNLQETDATDGWIVALRNKILKWLPGVPELPASQTTANEVTMMDLLSIRPRSHCSSSSSLGSLDMDPNCRLTDARMFTIQLQSACRRNTTDFDQHLVTQCSDDVYKEERLGCHRSTGSDFESRRLQPMKISPWRKVRSAVQWSPFVQTFRRQRYPWVQLAGHQGNFKIGGERGTILKKLCPIEENCFKLLMKDILRTFVPQYKGHIIADDGEEFIVLEDLLGGFSNPCVMDCKLGVRTYLEDELAKAKTKPKLRKDMFDKMCQVDPSAPTAEEIQMGGVTKPRYMVWRETISSTAGFGFRIEGTRKHDGTSSKDYKTLGTAPQILTVFEEFIKDRPHALLKYVERLEQLEKTLTSSEFFANHELIGTSLLFIHDKTKAGIWMIDFAKTHLVPDGIEIDHRSPWREGNHEDGYLTGLLNIRQMLNSLVAERHRNSSTEPCE